MRGERVAEAEIVPMAEPQAALPVASSPQSEVIAMIERVVLDPNASIEKLEKMLDLRDRIREQEKQDRRDDQRAVYFRAMAKCQSALKVVKRNKRNDQTKSRYADLAALAREADPIIHAHGFTFSTQPAGRAENGDERIRWTIAHDEGHIETGEAQLALDNKGPNGSVNKTGPHGFGSTMSYGRRYLKLMLFDIATSDDDDGNAAGGAESAAAITRAQFEELHGLIEETKSDLGKFLAHFGIDGLDVLPVRKFSDARQMLLRKKGKAND